MPRAPFRPSEYQFFKNCVSFLRLTFSVRNVSNKDDYLNALEQADLTGDYTKLYILLFQILLRRSAELCS